MAGTKKDADAAFHHFPVERRRHIGTTNPTGSVFATVRSRTRRIRGCLSGKTDLSMVRRLMMPLKGDRRRTVSRRSSGRLCSVTGQYRKAPPPDRIGPVTNFRA